MASLERITPSYSAYIDHFLQPLAQWASKQYSSSSLLILNLTFKILPGADFKLEDKYYRQKTVTAMRANFAPSCGNLNMCFGRPGVSGAIPLCHTWSSTAATLIISFGTVLFSLYRILSSIVIPTHSDFPLPRL